MGAADAPYISISPDADWIMMPVISHCAAVAIELPPNVGDGRDSSGQSIATRADYLICARQDESTLELVQTSPHASLGRLPLHGSFNLGRTRPTGLAYAPERGLLAVATRSGAIHLIEVCPHGTTRNEQRSDVATSPGAAPRR